MAAIGDFDNRVLPRLPFEFGDFDEFRDFTDFVECSDLSSPDCYFKPFFVKS